jgi:hypothetical protein
MFGHRYFGARYFGDRYFASLEGAVLVEFSAVRQTGLERATVHRGIRSVS